MEKKFPVVLGELRKEKGLSQKEAASMLGVSQALLSHYEKGIRECGQSFLVRAANFYGVSCDRLLGRSDGRGEGAETAGADGSDPTVESLMDAAGIIIKNIKKNDKGNGAGLETFLAIGFYKILLLQAQAGNLPKNWAGKAYVNGEVLCDAIYLSEADACSYRAMKPAKNKTPAPEAPEPDSVRALVEVAEKFILKRLAESTPPAPPEFLK